MIDGRAVIIAEMSDSKKCRFFMNDAVECRIYHVGGGLAKTSMRRGLNHEPPYRSNLKRAFNKGGLWRPSLGLLNVAKTRA